MTTTPKPPRRSAYRGPNGTASTLYAKNHHHPGTLRSEIFGRVRTVDDSRTRVLRDWEAAHCCVVGAR